MWSATVLCLKLDISPIVVPGYLQFPQVCLLQRLQWSFRSESSQLKVWIDKHGETRILLEHPKSCWINQPKSINPIKMGITSKYWKPVFRFTRMVTRIQRESRDDRVPERRDAHESSSHEPSLVLTPTRSVDQCLYSFPLTDLAISVSKDQNYFGSMQKTQRRSRTSCCQFWRLDNSRSQGPKRQLRVSKQSSIRSRGTEFSYSMDPGVSVQKQNFTRNPEKLAKVPGAREEIKSQLHWQFLGIRQSLGRSFQESLHVYTTPIGD